MTLEAWLIPPAAGALIGYLTNSIAIRMLFRPLEKKRFLGIPVPFTPGVIPRQRGELAERIAAMVARELLTEEVFLRRMGTPQFRKTLQKYIAGELPKTLGSVVPSFTGEIFPWRILREEDLASLVNALWPAVLPGVVAIVEAPESLSELERRVGRVLRQSLEQMGSLQRFLMTATQYDRQIEQMIPGISTRVVREAREYLQGDAVPHLLRDRLGRWARDHRDQSVAALAAAAGSTDSVQVLQDLLKRYRGSISRELARAAQTVLVQAVPGMMNVLDIHTVVRERIDSLDVERVEALILGIISRHLKWINIFGAFVGALIGTLQVALRFFGVF